MRNLPCVLLIALMSSQSLLCQSNFDETLLKHKHLRAEELLDTTFDNWFDSPGKHAAYLQNITRYPVSTEAFTRNILASKNNILHHLVRSYLYQAMVGTKSMPN